MKDKSNKEAADYYKLSIRTIVRLLKKYNLNYYNMKYNVDKLTEQQEEFVIASMLGDGMMHKSGRFRLKMKSACKEYTEYARKLLLPFSTSKLTEEKSNKPIHINGKFFIPKEDNGFTYASTMYTNTHPIFKEYRRKWYPNNKKHVPSDIKITPYILAHWFIQDGCNCYQKKTIVLCTDCFPLNEAELLVNKIKELGIECHVYKKRISIGAREYMKFIELVKPYITFECYQYKVDTSKVKETRPNYGTKLNLEKANEIRRLVADGMNKKEVAKMYGVGIVTINRIIKRVTHKSGFAIAGKAKTWYNTGK